MNPLIIYHAPCPDGFGAAYAAWRRFGDEAEYLPAGHDNYPVLTDVYDREVYILDFSFPRETILQIQEAAASLVVLDHHKSAKGRLEGIPGVFDLSRSGARIAWDYFHPETRMPYLIEAIEARDLYTWNVAGAGDFLAYLDTVPYDFLEWHKLARLSERQLKDVRREGKSMRIKFESLAREIAEAAEPVRLHGLDGHKVNATTVFANDVGQALYEQNGTFALMWRIEAGQLRVSLRARQGGPVDVSEIALQYGGGGHPGAAAFALELEHAETREFLERYIYGAGE